MAGVFPTQSCDGSVPALWRRAGTSGEGINGGAKVHGLVQLAGIIPPCGETMSRWRTATKASWSENRDGVGASSAGSALTLLLFGKRVAQVDLANVWLSATFLLRPSPPAGFSAGNLPQSAALPEDNLDTND